MVGGALISATAELHQELAEWCNCLGVSGSPFDSYLTLRGLRTLAARLRSHAENAARLARAIVDHPAVAKVYFPGLPDDPGHQLAARQQSSFGAMLSFELVGGETQVRALLDGLQCFSLAESLGGVESLIAHPATMTHASMSADARAVAGISDQLLRLSVGIEGADDLIADLLAGLNRALSVATVRRAA